MSLHAQLPANGPVREHLESAPTRGYKQNIVVGAKSDVLHGIAGSEDCSAGGTVCQVEVGAKR